jgi:hypothetical protein
MPDEAGASAGPAAVEARVRSTGIADWSDRLHLLADAS